MLLHLVVALGFVLYLLSAFFCLSRIYSTYKEGSAAFELTSRINIFHSLSRYCLLFLLVVIYFNGYSLWSQGNAQLLFLGGIELIILIVKWKHLLLSFGVSFLGLLVFLTSAVGSHISNNSYNSTIEKSISFQVAAVIHGISALLAECTVFIVVSLCSASLIKNFLLKKKAKDIILSKLPDHLSSKKLIQSSCKIGLILIFISLTSTVGLGGITSLTEFHLILCTLFTLVYFISVIITLKSEKYSLTQIYLFSFFNGLAILIWFLVITTFYSLSHKTL